MKPCCSVEPAGRNIKLVGSMRPASRISLASVVARSAVLARGLDPPTFWPLPTGLHPVISLSTVGSLRSARSSEAASAYISDKGATINMTLTPANSQGISRQLFSDRVCPHKAPQKCQDSSGGFSRRFSSEAQCARTNFKAIAGCPQEHATLRSTSKGFNSVRLTVLRLGT